MTNRLALRRARKAKGFSQFDLAVKAGTTETTIRRVERGYDPSWSVGLRMAEALGLDCSAIRAVFGEEGER